MIKAALLDLAALGAGGAGTLVEQLRLRQVAVAPVSSPLCPEDVLRQQLAAIGLSPSFGDYAKVAHAGNMHFPAHDPALYVEIAARIGVEPDETLLVAGGLDSVLPARQVGLHTFHVLPAAAGNSFIQSSADGSGALDDLLAAVAGGWLDALTPRPLIPEMIEPEMRGSIGALFGTLADAKPDYWRQQPVPGEWSLLQIVCHLLASEAAVQRARLQRILAEDNPFIADPPPAPREAPPCDDDGMAVARRFAEEREATIHWLQTLRPQDWLRPARHSIFGPTTLLEMAHFTTQHDRLHINQLCLTLGRCT